MGRKRTTTRAPLRTAAALGAVLTLGGCVFIDDRGMQITVANRTDQTLVVRVLDHPQGTVAPGTSKDLVPAQAPGCLAVDVLDAITEDDALVADHPSTACDGDTWTIEQSDLVPGPEPSPSPTS